MKKILTFLLLIITTSSFAQKVPYSSANRQVVRGINTLYGIVNSSTPIYCTDSVFRTFDCSSLVYGNKDNTNNIFLGYTSSPYISITDSVGNTISTNPKNIEFIWSNGNSTITIDSSKFLISGSYTVGSYTMTIRNGFVVGMQ